MIAAAPVRLNEILGNLQARPELAAANAAASGRAAAGGRVR
jgi:hypothetical protein